MKNLALVALALVGLVLASCGKQEAAPIPTLAPTQPAAATVNAGQLYGTNCAMCHGANRQGIPNIAPPVTGSALAPLSNDQVRQIISEGKTNTAMTGFKGRLSPDKIDALVRLVKG